MNDKERKRDELALQQNPGIPKSNKSKFRQMMRYETYKPSGIEWIGDIPEHWEVKKLKHVANVETGNTPPMSDPDNYADEGLPWIKPDNLNDFNLLTTSEEQLSSQGISKARVVRRGAVLVCCIGTVGKMGVAGRKLTTNQQINAIEFNSRVWDEYGKYMVYSSEQEHIKQSNRVVVSILNKINQSQIKFPIPPLPEQLSISTYLDSQTQKIDQLIANKKAQVERLKELRQIEINNAVTKGLNPHAPMKDSGIEWLGEIPGHWGVKRVKNVFSFYNNVRIPLSSEERADLEKIYDYYGASGVIDQVDRFLFDGDYILVGEDGANLLDRSSPLAFKASGKFWVNNHAHIIKPKTDDIDYYTFLLESIDFTTYITGSAQPKMTIEQLSSVTVVVPPKKEQLQIAEHLKERTAAIDKLIKNTMSQIEKLQELRKIKIYEAVTGKVKCHA